MLIVSSDVSSEEESRCLSLEASKPGEQDIFSPADLRNCCSETNQTSSYCSCTTEHTAAKSLRVFLLSRGKKIDILKLSAFSFYRKNIVLRAKEMGVRLTNGNAKMKKVSAE